MNALKHFKIRRQDDISWNYVVEVADDRGGTQQLSATFEDIDRIAFEIDEQMNVLLEAAEREGMGR